MRSRAAWKWLWIPAVAIAASALVYLGREAGGDPIDRALSSAGWLGNSTDDRKTPRLFASGDAPRVGLSRSEVLRSGWGSPQSESKISSGNGETEFWHYDRGMVMMRDGVVISVTERR